MRRISLSNSAFEGNSNVLLFTNGPETILIDTGDRQATTHNQLRAALNKYGVGFPDIDRIFLTHWHGDHTGQAGEIQEMSGADVYVHAMDGPLVEGDENAWNEMQRLQGEYFEEWGIPPEKQRVLNDIMPGAETIGKHPTVSTFSDGDVFSVNEEDLRVIHTSGHSAGLCMFERRFQGPLEVITGDTLLPVYTPNVGGADVRVDRPLERYLRALQGIIKTDYNRAWPGHRHPIDDPSQRAKHIIHHHEERAWRVLNTLRHHGACDAWSVSAELFGELDGIHILHGPGEAYAHLTHLERTNNISCEGGEYRITDATKCTLDSIDDKRWKLDY